VTGPGRVGVDTGGTFTDVVDALGTVVKLPSDPDDPSRAVAAGVGRVGGAAVLATAPTVATNALLERRGGPVALVTTEGPLRCHRDRPPGPAVAVRHGADRPTPLVPRTSASR